MANHATKELTENNNMETALEALGKNIARLTDKGELHTTAIPGLALFRREEPTEPISGMYEPSICLVAQGAKRVLLGDDTYIYDPHHYLITSVHLPTVVQIIEASGETLFGTQVDTESEGGFATDGRQQSALHRVRSSQAVGWRPARSPCRCSQSFGG